MATKITLDVSGEKEVLALLDRLPKLVVAAGGPTDRALKSSMTVLQRKAIALAPDSRRTGTRQKQSKASRKIWHGTLRKLIRTKLIRYQTGAYGLVGPKSPEGNMANFVNGVPRRMVLWGKVTRVAMYRYTRNWLVQANDESRAEQLSAIQTSLTKDIDKIMRSGQ